MNEIKFFFKFINKTLFLALTFSFLSALSSILLFSVSAYLITSAAFSPPLYTLGAAITLVRAAGLFRAVFKYLERIITHSAAFKIEENLRLNYYEKAIRVLPAKEGELFEKNFLNGVIKGAQILRDFFIRALNPIILTFILALTTFVVIFHIIGYTAIVIIFVWIIHLSLPFVIKNNETEKNLSVEYRSILSDRILGKILIYFAGSAKNILPALNGKSDALSNIKSFQKIQNLRADFILECVRNLAFVFIFAALVNVYQKEVVNIVWLSVYTFLILTILEEFSQISISVRQGKESVVYAKDLEMKVSRKIPSKNILKENPPLLEVKNLSFGYNKNENILQNISFTVNSGEKIAIIGESGAGKTTLANVLLNLYEKTSGDIYINGENYDNLTSENIRKNFSALLQNTHIFNGTVRDNFKFLYGDISDKEIISALKLCNLNFDLNLKIGTDGNNLSGGERTRLLTALALIRPAPILILDEPTLGLDAKNAEDIVKNILIISDKAIILITHNKNLLKYVDRVISLTLH